MINLESFHKLTSVLRDKLLDDDEMKFLIANLDGSSQAKDLRKSPNCEGCGRIRHFKRRHDYFHPEWVDDPLPMDPVTYRMGLRPVDTIEAQLFQIAGCNFRCWYCFVSDELISGSDKYGKYFTPDELIDLYLKVPNRPFIIDISGGQPGLVPEFTPHMMQNLTDKRLENQTFIWEDDNLSSTSFFNLNNTQKDTVLSYPYYSRVCCFKGFSEESFAFNTKCDSSLWNLQFSIIEEYIKFGLDIYAYATFTSSYTDEKAIKYKMATFVDKLQQIHDLLPLRVVPLQIFIYTPVKSRLQPDKTTVTRAISNQIPAIMEWKNQLRIRFSPQQLSANICSHSIKIK